MTVQQKINEKKKQINVLQKELQELEESQRAQNSFVMVYEKWFELTKSADLNFGELILLCKINSLTKNALGECTAKNKYFADLLKVSEDTIKNYIRHLKKVGLIESREKKAGLTTTTRFLSINIKRLEELLGEEGEVSTLPQGNPEEYDGEKDMSGRGKLTYENAKKVLVYREKDDAKIEDKRIKENSIDTAATAVPALMPEPTQTVSHELTELVFEMFTQKKRYSDIQAVTGLNFETIKQIIDNGKENRREKYMESANQEDDKRILQNDGTYGSYSKKNFEIHPDDCEHFYKVLTDEDGEFMFDKEFVKTWFCEELGWTGDLSQ